MVCGPWVANNGQLSTHTDTLVGNIDTQFFAQDVQVDFEGLNFIIAHLRVGNIQIALGKQVEVVPRKCMLEHFFVNILMHMPSLLPPLPFLIPSPYFSSLWRQRLHS